MGIVIQELQRAPEGGWYTSPARLYITAAGELCDEGDGRAAFLLVPKGGQIPVAEAARYGLLVEAGAKERHGTEDKQRKPDGDKASPANGPKSLSKMNRTELDAAAQEAGVGTSGTNSEIVGRIRAARAVAPVGTP